MPIMFNEKFLNIFFFFPPLEKHLMIFLINLLAKSFAGYFIMYIFTNN